MFDIVAVNKLTNLESICYPLNQFIRKNNTLKFLDRTIEFTLHLRKILNQINLPVF